MLIVAYLIAYGTHYPVRVPTGTDFPVGGKSGSFEQTGKIRENHTKYWKTQEGLSDKCYFSDI